MAWRLHLCAATLSALLLHQRLRVLQVLGQSNRRLLGRLARRARKCDLFATFLRDELGVELARAQLDDVLVASLALAELELVCDADPSPSVTCSINRRPTAGFG